MKAGRELVEEWSQFLAEHPRQLNEAVDFGLAAEQLLQMGDEAIDLDRVAKSRRSLLAPTLEGGRERKAIEARIDLHRVEFFRIALEPALLRQAFGIEDPAPVFVDPAGTADVNFGNSRSLHRCNST